MGLRSLSLEFLAAISLWKNRKARAGANELRESSFISDQYISL